MKRLAAYWFYIVLAEVSSSWKNEQEEQSMIHLMITLENNCFYS